MDVVLCFLLNSCCVVVYDAFGAEYDDILMLIRLVIHGKDATRQGLGGDQESHLTKFWRANSREPGRYWVTAPPVAGL